ncbi:MAG: hypothetical protein JST36_11215 [Bacteroidetes bacterium]|nr:hypothetical protein [Bacteroidota bacterium]
MYPSAKKVQATLLKPKPNSLNKKAPLPIGLFGHTFLGTKNSETPSSCCPCVEPALSQYCIVRQSDDQAS